MSTTEQNLATTHNPALAVRGAGGPGALGPALDEVARHLQRFGVRADGNGKALLRLVRENNVKRVVQVYWTPFQADIPGDSVGLHLEIADPLVHWVEGYISPTGVSWIFAFHERASDGEYQLAHYAQFREIPLAVEAFFNIASWYALTPTDLSWDDVVTEVDPNLGWTRQHAVRASAGEVLDKAVQEALKKSSIVWLRWTHDGVTQTMPVWFVLQQDKIYVLSGERQQTIPNATELREVDVIIRWKGKNTQIADLPARVRVIPQGEEWDTLAEKIAEKRLNIPGLPEDTARRWRDECHILELTIL